MRWADEIGEAANSDSDSREVVFEGRERKNSSSNNNKKEKKKKKKKEKKSIPPPRKDPLHDADDEDPPPAADEEVPAPTNTFEGKVLAERILTLVSPHDLLINVSRVCHRWNEILATSSILQQKLFLKPQPGPTATLLIDAFYTNNNNNLNEDNNGLNHHNRTSYKSLRFVQSNYHPDIQPPRPIHVHSNPLMTKTLIKDLLAWEGYPSPSSRATPGYLRLEKSRKETLGEGAASYCQMLAFQPPVVKVHFLALGDGGAEGDGEGEGKRKIHVVERKSGVLIWDLILKKELRGEFRWIAVEWEVLRRGRGRGRRG